MRTLFDEIKSSAVLKTKGEVKNAIAVIESLHLPLHVDPPKNWDSLAALALINRHFEKQRHIKILDAGGETYSVILKQLQKLGYSDLTSINIVFENSFVQDGITFRYGDITNSNFPNNHFNAITCLSVIEHGVDINLYFKEMSRILDEGGILITSLDYWDEPIDTRGQIAFGVPIKIFSTTDVKQMVEVAKTNSLELVAPLELKCKDKVVSWDEFSLDYTFSYFALRKEQKAWKL